MADLTPAVRTLLQRALDAAELGVVLELDADSIHDWRATLDLPGPVDVVVEHVGADTHVVLGPVTVDLSGRDLVARLDTPGPDLEVGLVGGEVRGPRFVRDGGNGRMPPSELLERRTRSIRRRVRLGQHDDELDELVRREAEGRARPRVLRCLRRRLLQVTD